MSLEGLGITSLTDCVLVPLSRTLNLSLLLMLSQCSSQLSDCECVNEPTLSTLDYIKRNSSCLLIKPFKKYFGSASAVLIDWRLWADVVCDHACWGNTSIINSYYLNPRAGRWLRDAVWQPAAVSNCTTSSDFITLSSAVALIVFERGWWR